MHRLDTQLALDDLARMQPRALEERLGNLIRHYARHCSADIAESVILHIEALHLRSDLFSGAEQDCVYRRFVRHWRWLATQQGTQNAMAI